MKKFISIVFALIMVFAMCIPAFAEEEAAPKYTKLNVMVDIAPGQVCNDAKFTFSAESTDNTTIHDITKDIKIGRAKQDKSCWAEVSKVKKNGVTYDIEKPEQNIYAIYMDKDAKFEQGKEYLFKIYLSNGKNDAWSIYESDEIAVNGDYECDVDFSNSENFMVSSVLTCNSTAGGITPDVKPSESSTTTVVSDPTKKTDNETSTTVSNSSGTGTSEEAEEGESPDTGSTGTVLVVCLVVIAAAVLVVFLTKKKNNDDNTPKDDAEPNV